MTRDETYQHLLDRGLDPALYPCAVDAGVVAFYLYDFGGKLLGYQNYRPFADRNNKNVKEARYFTYLPKKTQGYFGLHTLEREGPVYLVEGVFKAAKLHKLGLACVALMGSETKQHMNQLLFLRRPLVGVGDNDKAGEKFAKAFGGFVSPRDLDEMSDDEVRKLLYDQN